MIAALMIAASVLFTGTVATPASFGSASRRLEPAHHKSPCIGECALRSSALAATLALTTPRIAPPPALATDDLTRRLCVIVTPAPLLRALVHNTAHSSVLCVPALHSVEGLRFRQLRGRQQGQRVVLLGP